jgi:hypothetical protein
MTGQGKCQQIVNANTLPFAYEHRGEMHVVRPSPASHWKTQDNKIRPLLVGYLHLLFTHLLLLIDWSH